MIGGATAKIVNGPADSPAVRALLDLGFEAFVSQRQMRPAL